MTRKNLFFSALIFACAIPRLASAQVSITEIMYDPPGSDSKHEWIELHGGASSTDLSKWKLSVAGADHELLPASSMVTLAPEGYAVVAANADDFAADHPNYAGELFRASFSLGNASGAIELKNASGAIMASASYGSSLGAKGDGNSLNRAPYGSAPFAPHASTPGEPLSAQVIPPKEKPVLPAKGSNKKTAKLSGSSSHETAVIGEPLGSLASASSQIADVSVADQGTLPSWYWQAGLALAVAIGGAFAASAARSKKEEWDIVEESEESA